MADEVEGGAPSETQPRDTSGVQLEVVGRTDVGLIREHNEDSFLLLRLDDNGRDAQALRRHKLGERGTLLVVCDGMGGAAAGEVASSMAIDSVGQVMLSDGVAPPPPGLTDDALTALGRKLRMAAQSANTQIFTEARQNVARSGMGTTMTAVLLRGTHAVIAQVGDSRAYVWRDGHFTQVTRDQSLVNQLLETGHITPEQAKYFEHSNVILQALGVQEEVEVQLSQVELRAGDRFLVCSDGLVGVVSDEEIAAVMGACDDLEEAARILIEMANSAGGPDNISVIVAKVAGDALKAPVEADRLTYQLWKIDPDEPAPAAEDPAATLDVGSPTFVEAPAARRPAPPRNATVELVSMAVVFGLVLGSVLTGAVLYKNGVPCRVQAPKEGLSVISDGRDTGVRTPMAASPSDEGARTWVRLRLKPGHHTLQLRGAGAPEAARDIEVVSGALCEASFEEPSRADADHPALPTAVPLPADAIEAAEPAQPAPAAPPAQPSQAAAAGQVQ